MARSNKTVQTRLFHRVDLLLSKEGAPGELAEALTEVWTLHELQHMDLHDDTLVSPFIFLKNIHPDVGAKLLKHLIPLCDETLTLSYILVCVWVGREGC